MSENFQEAIKDISTKLDYSLYAKDYQKALEQIKNLIQFHQLNNSLTYQMILQRAQLQFQSKMYKNCFEHCLQAQDMLDQHIKKNQPSSQTNAKAQQISFLMMRSLLQLGEVQMAKKELNTFLETRDNFAELLKLSTAINRLSKHNPYVLSPQQQTILAELKSWLYKAGSSYDKLKVIKLGENYRGVIATKQIRVCIDAIQKGQKIVFVPHSHIITLQMAKKTSLAKKILQKKIQLLSPKHTLLSILLLEERKKTNSKWKLYLDLLPENHSSFPINYQKQQLMELVGSNFLYQIREKVIDLKKDYETLINLDAQFGNHFNFKAFCWARTIIGSRIFGLVIDSVKTEVLVPFADMLNHKIPKQTVWNYSDELNGFIIESLEDIMPGQQVFDSYGKKCNSRFLLNYGFVLPENNENQISLKLSLNDADILLSRKMEMLKQTTSLSKVYKISINMEDNNFYELMGYLRFHQVSDSETILLLQKISGIKENNTAYRPAKTPPINIDLEIKVWKFLHQFCQENLKGYSTSIEQDEKLLKQLKSQNIQNIIILRLGQKKILRFYIEQSLKIIQLLQKGRKQAKQYAEAHQQQSFSSYLNKILPIMLPNRQSKNKTKIQENIEPNQKLE